MPPAVKKKSQVIFDQLSKLIKKNFSAKKSAIIIAFSKRYFGTISARDLCDRAVDTLYGELICHWQLIENQQPGKMQVRVYNPSIEEDGWQSNHTVVQIIHEDMPFLVDSVRMEINRLGYLTHFIINLGDVSFKRDTKGNITQVSAAGQPIKDIAPQATIYVEIEQQLKERALHELEESLKKILSDVSAAVNDWQAMRERMRQSLALLEENPPPFNKAEVSESKDFLRWLENDNFTFLGCRDYKYLVKNGKEVLQSIKHTGLGVLREDGKVSVRYLSDLPAAAKKLTLSSQILIFAKTRTRATVHRPAYTDYIGVKQFDEKGKLIGERRFIGLYTSSAYNSSTVSIPFVRHKVARVIKDSKFSRNSHAGKALLNILENLPRDDLFQAPPKELLELSLGILHLQDRQRIRLFIRKDSYGRFYSCLVFVPRDKFNSELCEKMERILSEELQTPEIAFEPLLSESALVCIHFVAYAEKGKIHTPNLSNIEKRLVDVGRSWKDKLREALINHFAEVGGLKLYRRYCAAFPLHYQETFPANAAASDICCIEALSKDNVLNLDLYDPKDGRGFIRFKVFQRHHTAPLSDALPILENMGLRVIGERPYRVQLENESVWINDFDMVHTHDRTINIKKVRDAFHQAFSAIWLGRAKDDTFNRLVLALNLNWKQVALLRAYAKYFRQIGIAFSEYYIAETLSRNLEVTKALIELFRLRFDPEIKRSQKNVAKKAEQIVELLNQVASLDEDRILNQYLEVIQASLRVNYYQPEVLEQDKPYLVFKLNPAQISDMPLPHPMYEIYVYSTQFEGIHLRAAKVARGGLRWSDRQEDFRTEVLGLMKAQQVKNACIIPQGAKGGFVVKHIPADASRDQLLAQGVKCYRLFIQAMLDVTDNVIDNEVISPQNVVTYDEHDAYLVVAADKGTATFSDIANDISQANQFWLGDAFASGGSTGYDHKKMGITARGAWESVKRHFREMGRDIQTSGFSAVGIGDMSGDVFGNGVLLSHHMRLIAAFNHLHIFIDPDPSVTKSYKERQRLFKLPRSTWKDYNPNLISKGGGVFSRAEKAIKLSAEMKALFDVKKDYIVPNELIRLILKLPVDLLWNGGIGTFVKASDEDNASVGDRANDASRVDANELRCKVVGEGGNLGLTQLARIEYDLNGGRIYTDFIDNAAGVNCSDHEVNIKILLNDAVAHKKLTFNERNELLADMTDEVTDLVLRDNYRQTQAVSLAVMKASNNIDLYARYMNDLEGQDKLDLDVEFLPSDKEINERKSAGKGLTCPEISVLFAYSKNILKEQILNSNVPEDPYLSQMLSHEFPRLIRYHFDEEMKNHMLRREIIATQVSNILINELGFTFIPRLQEETGASVENIVRAFTISQKVFGKRSLWQEIERLDLKVDTDTQFIMMRQLNRLIRRATRWFLRHHRDNLEIAKTVSHFAKPIAFLANNLTEYLTGDEKEFYLERLQTFMETGAPEKISARVAAVMPLFSSLDIIQCVIAYKLPVDVMARTYYTLGERLGLDWIRQKITAVPPEHRWEALLRTSLRDDLDYYQRLLAVAVLQTEGCKAAVETCVDNWIEQRQSEVLHWQDTLASLKSSAVVDVVRLSVAMREIVDFVQMTYRRDAIPRKDLKNLLACCSPNHEEQL